MRKLLRPLSLYLCAAFLLLPVLHSAGQTSIVVPLVQPPAPTSTLLTGQVGWWKFDEASGDAVDTTGGNTCVLTGSTYSAGAVGNAINFDGVDDFCTIGDPASGVLDFGTADFSIAFRIKGATGQSGPMLLYKGASGSGPAGFSVHLAAGDILRLRYSDGGTPFLHAGTTDVLDGTWKCITIVADRDVGTLFYVGGSLVNTVSAATAAESVDGTIALSVGARGASSDLEFTGSIDDLRFWNRVLTGTEATEYCAYAG